MSSMTDSEWKEGLKGLLECVKGQGYDIEEVIEFDCYTVLNRGNATEVICDIWTGEKAHRKYGAILEGSKAKYDELLELAVKIDRNTAFEAVLRFSREEDKLVYINEEVKELWIE